MMMGAKNSASKKPTAMNFGDDELGKLITKLINPETYFLNLCKCVH